MAEAQRSRNWKRSAVLFAEKGKNGGGGWWARRIPWLARGSGRVGWRVTIPWPRAVTSPHLSVPSRAERAVKRIKSATHHAVVEQGKVVHLVAPPCR
jgi:hypothetical protein